jgi:hypothetical protein
MNEKTILKPEIQKEFFLTCDWLQLHVKHETDYLTHENPFYIFKLVGQSKVFKQIYEIKDISMNIVIGQYCTGANIAIMPESEGVLKFENAQLYCHDNFKEFVVKFLKKARFKFIGITRFDIAMDFQEFDNKLNPGIFIKKFLRAEFVSVKNVQFGCYGKQQGLHHNISSLSFGSRKSNVTYKLYNKTKELEVSGKTWIKRAHEVNFADQNKDVWRLEFSISSLSAFMKGQGKDFSFHSLECLDFLNMYGIYIGLFNKNFRFKVKKKEKRKTRMCDLKLWEFPLNDLEIKIEKKNPMIKKSTISEKIFVKKLDQFNKEFRLFDENFDYAAKDLIAKIIDIHCLHDWAIKKGIEFEGQENYINNVYEFAQIKASHEKLQNDYTEAISNQMRYEFEQATC